MSDFEEKIQELLKLKGLDFVQGLLKIEEDRFNKEFLKGSVYEEINADFGLFPPLKIYPVYFLGNIARPENKRVFIGINPGYDRSNSLEQKFLEERGCFDGYCNIFGDFLRKKHKGLSSKYFSNIAGFLKRFYELDEINNWTWFQDNIINLDFIPYHSKNAAGIRINNIEKFRKVYFQILLKFLEHINPRDYIFVNGFPTFEGYFQNDIFIKAIQFKKVDNFWIGNIGRFKFIGLPFLTQVSGGKDNLVNNIRRYLADEATS
ncbi:MAG: hypothetical protein PHT44_01745 [Candidatus Portnoybacteria bacterium]|nr:hypothetical protein [Candidatus Portnoybacteria bacterium]MDD4982682.1 hypothetical protein [Candidatus Portnoybacteria bacterium]